MAALDTAQELGKVIKAARKRVPEVKAHIRTRQKEAEVKEGHRELAGLDDQLEKAAELSAKLGASPPPTPEPGPEPEPEPDTPTIPGPYPDPVPPAPDPSNELRGKSFTGGKVQDGAFLSLAGRKNFIITSCKFTKSERRIIKGDAGRGVLLTNSFIDEMLNEKEHGIFPGENWQTSDDAYYLSLIGLDFGPKNQQRDICEFKGSFIVVAGCTGRFSVRSRHGVGHVVINNPDLWNHSMRCGPHFSGNNPKARIMLYSGNLDGRKGHWEPDSGAPDSHEPAGGHNMQSAVECGVVGVRAVELGFHFGENDKKYPPLGCIIDPSLRDKTKITAEKGTRWETPVMPKLKAIQSLENIRSRMVRDVAEAPVRERNREHEVYEWYLESVANAMRRQAGVPV